jgi:hypothetical protein
MSHGTIRYSVTNDQLSILLIRNRPELESSTFGPGGNVDQVVTWTIPSPRSQGPGGRYRRQLPPQILQGTPPRAFASETGRSMQFRVQRLAATHVRQ